MSLCNSHAANALASAMTTMATTATCIKWTSGMPLHFSLGFIRLLIVCCHHCMLCASVLSAWVVECDAEMTSIRNFVSTTRFDWIVMVCRVLRIRHYYYYCDAVYYLIFQHYSLSCIVLFGRRAANVGTAHSYAEIAIEIFSVTNRALNAI